MNNINTNFGIIINNIFSYSPRDPEFNHQTYVNCQNPDIYFALNYREIIDNKEERLGSTAILSSWTQEEDRYEHHEGEKWIDEEGQEHEGEGWDELVYRGKIILDYAYEPIVAPKPDKADYDRAMENHLMLERNERGYTDREPTDYTNSSVPRFALDAADWCLHRDQVMLYGLSVINEYEKTGNAPSLTQFIQNLPKITWTYNEEM